VRSAAIVLDDYHLVDSAAVHRAVQSLVEAAPRHLHVVLATREDPPLRLAQLRARRAGRLADLRFAPDEADRFLTSTMGLQLSPSDRAALLALTEGWAAGLHLAALAVRGQAEGARRINCLSGTQRFVLD
jgi:LuxR family maltose regulon positive regulatory protein